MDSLKPIENKLAELFKGAPQLSASTKKSLAGVMEWVAIIFGILQVLAVIGLWTAGHRVNQVVNVVNQISASYGGKDVSSGLGIMYYLALVVLAVSAATLLLAYPGLKARKKDGWNWLFLGALINLVYGVVSIFVSSTYGGGFGDFIWSLIGSAIGFYLLFQVRELYSAKAKSADK